jgi:hypothetical protein
LRRGSWRVVCNRTVLTDGTIEVTLTVEGSDESLSPVAGGSLATAGALAGGLLTGGSPVGTAGGAVAGAALDTLDTFVGPPEPGEER